MNALIVDDDIPTTQVIADSVDWARLGISDVRVAHAVGAAQKLILAQAPDVVVCDIEMPQASGLDLIGWCREREMDCQFVFLTCHEEFSFAATALRHEAVDYILKPFNLPKLQQALLRAVVRVQGIQKTKQREGFLRSNQETIDEAFWRELLFGVIAPDELAIAQSISRRGLTLDTASVRVPVLVSTHEQVALEMGWEAGGFQSALKRLGTEIQLGGEQHSYVAYAQDGRTYLFVAASDQSLERIENLCNELIRVARVRLGTELSCYIGAPVRLDQLLDARDSLQRQDKANISARGRVISGEQRRVEADEPPRGIDTECLQRLLSERAGAEAVNLLRRELEQLMQQQMLTRERLHAAIEDYLQVVYSTLHMRGIQAHQLFSDEASERLRKPCENSMFDAMKWASHLTTRALDAIRHEEQSGSVAARLQRYVSQHYQEPISRETLAQQVHLTPDYMSKMFKAETGKNLNDYVSQLRIDKAKELLLQGTLGVSQVAQEVGFDNFSYFSTLFKKLTGLSPSEYQRKRQ